jgi:hypothetical protein
MRAITPLGGMLAAASLCMAACGDPEFKTELNPEGPPQVAAVHVASEAAGELATFCGTGDVSTLFCPNDGTVQDAPPIAWYVRIIFDELLDGGALETITCEGEPEVCTAELSGTPVNLSCEGTAVTYTGFYDPSGNYQTFPPGPALVIQAADFAATGSDCEVTITGEVVDKDGNTVPEAERGPYSFTIAPLAIVGAEPADGSEGVDPLAAAAVFFNAPIDAASLDGNITLEDAGANPVAATLSVAADDQTMVIIQPDAALDENAMYTVTVTSGIEDIGGGALTLAEPFIFSFTTGALVLPDAGTDTPDADTTDAGVDAGV